MATTMRLISKQTLGSNAATVTFSQIPSTYTDLVLVGTFNNSNSVVDNAWLRVNGASNNTNHSGRRLSGNGSSASSGSDSAIYVAASFGSNGLSSFEIYIPNYAGSAAKSMSITGVAEVNQTTAYIYAIAGLWNSTAAVNQLTLVHESASNFATNSSFFLYGITKA
jgi:hypothetical protein